MSKLTTDNCSNLFASNQNEMKNEKSLKNIVDIWQFRNDVKSIKLWVESLNTPGSTKGKYWGTLVFSLDTGLSALARKLAVPAFALFKSSAPQVQF